MPSNRFTLKFGVTLTLGGRRATLIGVDIPVAWFFWGFPDQATVTTQMRGGHRRLHPALEAWADDLLTRSLYLGTADGLRLLTRDLVARLLNEPVPNRAEREIAPQRELAALRYLSAVGWLAASSDGFIDDAEEPPAVELPELALPTAEVQRAMTAVPDYQTRLAVRQVAEASQVPPHVVWREWTISEFSWSWRLLFEDRGAAATPVEEPPQAVAVGNVVPFRRPVPTRLQRTDDLLEMIQIGLEPEPKD
jgi:hypothetical protein